MDELILVKHLSLAAKFLVDLYKDSSNKYYITTTVTDAVLLDEAYINFINEHPECFARIYSNYKDKTGAVVTVFDFKGETVKMYINNILRDYYDGTAAINYDFCEKVAVQADKIEKLFASYNLIVGVINVDNLMWDGQRAYYFLHTHSKYLFTNSSVQTFGVCWNYFQARLKISPNSYELLAPALAKTSYWGQIKTYLAGIEEVMDGEDRTLYYLCAARLLCVLDYEAHALMWNSPELRPITRGIFIHYPKLLRDSFLQGYLDMSLKKN
jgi:hypothetical protein